jgi:hypothetical protein
MIGEGAPPGLKPDFEAGVLERFEGGFICGRGA